MIITIKMSGLCVRLVCVLGVCVWCVVCVCLVVWCVPGGVVWCVCVCVWFLCMVGVYVCGCCDLFFFFVIFCDGDLFSRFFDFFWVF